MRVGQWLLFQLIRVVSLYHWIQGIDDLRLADIKLNIQTYASQEMVSSWLQKKKKGRHWTCHSFGLCEKSNLRVELVALPLLLEQASKSVAQASATVLRALLDPVLKGLTWLWILIIIKCGDPANTCLVRTIRGVPGQLPGPGVAANRFPCRGTECQRTMEDK